VVQTSSETQVADAQVVPGQVAEAQVKLPDDVDLHARPAANFVRTAMRFTAKVFVGVDEKEVDAKSLLSVLSLGARRGTSIRLRAEGDDAAGAIAALATTVAELRE
jgi:phosphotransferase system HPr (HPr) family protein